MTLSELLFEPTYSGWQVFICLLIVGAISGAHWYARGVRAGAGHLDETLVGELDPETVARLNQGLAAENSGVEFIAATVSRITDPRAPRDARVQGHVYTAKMRCRVCRHSWDLRSESPLLPSECCPHCTPELQ